MDNQLFLAKLKIANQTYTYFSLPKFAETSGVDLNRLPFSLRILLENLLRHLGEPAVCDQDMQALINWQPQSAERSAIPFFPGRVLLQDFTGVPVVVDLAAMRAVIARLGGDPKRINPVIPVDLVIDHSLQVDSAGLEESLAINIHHEYERNRERYEFLRWGQQAFKNFRIVPPSSGIIHQVNLEYLASVVLTQNRDGERIAFPDTLVGSDSHSTMINGLGVLGWGVGGIEATAAMLGQPLDLVLPDVVGVQLHGSLREGVTPTDLTLTLTQMLRKIGVVNKFVEYFGPGVANLSLADRAMIANMTPENGSTIGYFPVDQQTLDYLQLSGRSRDQIALVDAYYKEQVLFRTENSPDPLFTTVLDVDLNSIEPCLAGPRRPQDRVPIRILKDNFENMPRNTKGQIADNTLENGPAEIALDGKHCTLADGSIVIAAITSCTNTSDPYVMVAAGLVAKKAVARGLKVPAYVKTSLTPGSKIVTSYLQKAGLIEPLAQLGFTVAGYGCATCIGNSGPLHSDVVKAIQDHKLTVAAVLSGNRNFEGRVHPLVQANYLASPALAVAYALAGTVCIDLESEPIGHDQNGQVVYLRDLWPTSREIGQIISDQITPDLFSRNYAALFEGDEHWQAIKSFPSDLYPWQSYSTYLQEPPFFESLEKETASIPSTGMRVLAMLGDSITTDHISPAGDIAVNSAAGKYLQALGVPASEFNSYGSRRGNYQVMARGTLANIRIQNKMLPGQDGSFAVHLPDGAVENIYDTAMRYKAERIPLLLIAGKEYGTGSSRDWAAKGPLLLGIRAVIAESFERIHRSNLVGMGIYPLTFEPGENAEKLGLSGRETFEILALDAPEKLMPGQRIPVRAYDGQCHAREFTVKLAINTNSEMSFFRQGGLLPAFVKKMMG